MIAQQFGFRDEVLYYCGSPHALRCVAISSTYFITTYHMSMKQILCASLLAIVFAGTGCKNQSATTSGTDTTGAKTTSSAEDNKKRTAEFYALMSSHQFDKLDAYMTTDFVDHDPDPGQGPGVAGVKKSFQELLVGFPDFAFKTDDMIAEGDLVATRGHVTGTNSGAFMGMPATGKKINVEIIDWIRIKDGKAVERWGLLNTPMMMDQLGMGPHADAEAKAGGKPEATAKPGKN